MQRYLALFAALAVWLTAASACASSDDGAGDATPSPTSDPSAAPSGTDGGTSTTVPSDGAMILYRDSRGDIIARDIATSDAFRQTIDYTEEVVVTAACSPDSRRIAYLKQEFDQRNRTLIVAGEGAPAEPFELSSFVQDIAWSPDGTKIAFSEWDGIGQIATISYLDLATGEITELTGGDDYAAGLTWSPDGSRLAYFLQDIGGQGSAIYAVPFDGGDPERLTPADSDLDWLDPTWTPDGSALIAAGSEEAGTQLFRIDPDSHEAAPLTTSTDIFKRGPRVSPDGKLIAYTGSVVVPGVARIAVALHTFGIFLLNSDGTNEHALTADPRLNPGAQVDPYLDAFLIGWCLPGPWLNDTWAADVPGATP